MRKQQQAGNGSDQHLLGALGHETQTAQVLQPGPLVLRYLIRQGAVEIIG